MNLSLQHSNGEEASPDQPSSYLWLESLPLSSSNILYTSLPLPLSTWITLFPRTLGHIWINYVLFTTESPVGSIASNTWCKCSLSNLVNGRRKQLGGRALEWGLMSFLKVSSYSGPDRKLSSFSELPTINKHLPSQGLQATYGGNKNEEDKNPSTREPGRGSGRGGMCMCMYLCLSGGQKNKLPGLLASHFLSHSQISYGILPN